MPRRPVSSTEYSRTLVSRNDPNQGTPGPRAIPAPTIRNGISPTYVTPSRVSGLVPGGIRCATCTGSTAQCRKVRSRQLWFIITGPVSSGAAEETGSTPEWLTSAS